MGTYDKRIIDYINLFENITRSSVRDCFFQNDILVFVVTEGQASKAIGKNGRNVIKFARLINKRLKVIEYHSDPLKFMRNLIAPIKPKYIKLEDKTLEVFVENTKDKGLLIGRDKRNLENFKKVMKSYFKVENIKIR